MENDTDKILGMNRILFFSIVILLCILSLCVGIYAQFFYKYAETDAFMFGINVGQSKSEEEIAKLKSEFSNLFNNTVEINGNKNVSKIDSSKEIIYAKTDLSKEEKNYSVNTKIPTININSDTAKEMNNNIEDTFYDKLESVMADSEDYTVYNVDYKAYINGDLLSLAIRSTLKEGSNPQRVIIQTYNYNLASNSKVTLEQIIDAKGMKKSVIQSQINKEIEELNKKDEELMKASNYNITLRDVNSDIYKIENTNVFLVSNDNYVYAIYAYGNNDYTSKMDIVVF